MVQRAQHDVEIDLNISTSITTLKRVLSSPRKHLYMQEKKMVQSKQIDNNKKKEKKVEHGSNKLKEIDKVIHTSHNHEKSIVLSKSPHQMQQ